MPLPPRPKIRVNRITTSTGDEYFILDNPFICKDSAVRDAIREELGISGAPFAAGDISASGAIAFANGSFQKCVTDGIQPITITGGSEGAKLELWVTDSGSGSTVTTTADMLDGNTFSGQILTSGQTCVMLFGRLSGGWVLLESFVRAVSGGADIATQQEAFVGTNTVKAVAPASLSLSGLRSANLNSGQFYSIAKMSAWSGGSGTASPLRFVSIGDSFSSYGWSPTWARNGGTLNSGNYTGGAAWSNLNAGWFNGTWATIPSGGTAQYYSSPSTDGKFDTWDIVYLKESGAGSIQVDYSENAGSSWTTNATTFSADNATTIGAVTTVTVANPSLTNRRIKLTASGGSVKVLGVIGYNANKIGVINISGLWDGSSADYSTYPAVADAVLNPIWTALAPDLVVMCTNDPAAQFDVGGGTRALYDKTQALRAATDWIIVGPHPCTLPGSGYDTEAHRLAAIEAGHSFALEKNQSYFDSFSLFRSYAAANAAGLYSDGIHLSSAGQTLRSTVLWSTMSVGRLPGGALSALGQRSFLTPVNDMSSFTLEASPFQAPNSTPFKISRSLSVMGGSIFAMDEADPSNESKRFQLQNTGSVWIVKATTSGTELFRFDASNPSARFIQSSFIFRTPALQINSSTTAVSITADNQSVTTTQLSFIRLTSDSATAPDRTFTLSNGLQGQILVLKWTHATNRAELANSGNVLLSAAWTPDQNDTLTLIWDNAESKWTEMARSTNA